VVVIGAGLSGLACAKRLCDNGISVQILDGSDGVGGRVRSDLMPTEYGQFRIDRGFQVLLTAYPEARRALRLNALDLRPFRPGALIRFEGRFWRAADPCRNPLQALSILRKSPLITAKDVFALGVMDARLRMASESSAWTATEESAETFLRRSGLSDRLIDRFFRPFFGGVFLDRSLQTTARKLRWSYRMFARGLATLPANGMQAIPEQLAAHLGKATVRLGRRVSSVTTGNVEIENAEAISAKEIVIATDQPAAGQLIPGLDSSLDKKTTTVWFAAGEAPTSEPILFLDGDGTGPANHVAVVSNVQPSYAPAGKALISANIVAPFEATESGTAVEDTVREQMRDWFGPQVDQWTHLRTDTIRHALPNEDSARHDNPLRGPETSVEGILVAGDYLRNASINGALEAGRRAAERILASRTTA